MRHIMHPHRRISTRRGGSSRKSSFLCLLSQFGLHQHLQWPFHHHSRYNTPSTTLQINHPTAPPPAMTAKVAPPSHVPADCNTENTPPAKALCTADCKAAAIELAVTTASVNPNVGSKTGARQAPRIWALLISISYTFVCLQTKFSKVCVANEDDLFCYWLLMKFNRSYFTCRCYFRYGESVAQESVPV
jgi:hypothetical protein